MGFDSSSMRQAFGLQLVSFCCLVILLYWLLAFEYYLNWLWSLSRHMCTIIVFHKQCAENHFDISVCELRCKASTSCGWHLWLDALYRNWAKSMLFHIQFRRCQNRRQSFQTFSLATVWKLRERSRAHGDSPWHTT